MRGGGIDWAFWWQLIKEEKNECFVLMVSAFWMRWGWNVLENIWFLGVVDGYTTQTGPMT